MATIGSLTSEVPSAPSDAILALMGDVAERLLAEALALSKTERSALVDRLRDSLTESSADDDYTGAWTAELTRRLSEIEAGRAKLLSVADALAVIRAPRANPG